MQVRPINIKKKLYKSLRIKNDLIFNTMAIDFVFFSLLRMPLVFFYIRFKNNKFFHKILESIATIITKAEAEAEVDIVITSTKNDTLKLSS